MKTKRNILSKIVLLSLFICIAGFSNAQNNRIIYNGQELFLSGTNLAWIDFANDIGSENVNFERFDEVFRDIHDYGGNSVRLWLHTNGTTTPEFANDTVVGPGEGAIEDLTQILDIAYSYDVGVILCLWSFDMLRLDIGEPYLTQNRKILEEDAALNSYIEYALKPMVDSTKDHPGIIAWEVINEPEGMIPTAFSGGWSDIGHVSREDVQRLINRVAGAIHRVDADLVVTSGAHNMHSLTDKDNGDGNFYADDSLFNVGGDSDGYLDFYQVHHYEFPINPFEHDFEYWEMDKPLIVGEFHPGDSDLGAFSNYETLIESNYAGAMGWMWLDSYASKIKEEVQYTFLNHLTEVDIDNNIGDTPALFFEGPEIGAVFDTGSDIDFTAEALDTDGTITQVEFILYQEQAADSVLFIDAEEPYSYTWEGPAEGNYGVYGRTTDNDGYTKTSEKIMFTIGEPPRYRYEAEEAALTGNIEITLHSEASNGEYVDMKANADCSIEWIIPNCPAAGTYDMEIGYGVFYGEKSNFIVVNGDVANQVEIAFTGNNEDWQRTTLTVELVEGENTITILPSWGWMQFDFIAFPFERLPLATEILLSTESGNNYIDIKDGTLQMLAEIVPIEAAFYPIEWSVSPKALASIDTADILRAKKDGTLTVKATATDGSGVSGEIEITISNQSVGIAESNNTDFNIYPNPADNVLNIISVKAIEHIEIYNTQGEKVNVVPTNKNNTRLFVDDLTPGLYYIKLKHTDKSESVNLFVKQNK